MTERSYICPVIGLQAGSKITQLIVALQLSRRHTRYPNPKSQYPVRPYAAKSTIVGFNFIRQMTERSINCQLPTDSSDKR